MNEVFGNIIIKKYQLEDLLSILLGNNYEIKVKNFDNDNVVVTISKEREEME